MLNFKKFLEADFDNSAGDDFWGNVGAGILAVSRSTGKILVAMRSRHVNEPGTFGVVGGKVDDPDVDLEEEAKREFKEETGFSGSMLIVPAYVFKSPSGSFQYHNFIGVIPKEFNPKVNWETEYFQWVTLDELMVLEPKHFGLNSLIANSMGIIRQYAR